MTDELNILLIKILETMTTKVNLFEEGRETFLTKWNSWRSGKKMARNAIFTVFLVSVIVSLFKASNQLNLLLSIEIEVIVFSLLFSWINAGIDEHEPKEIVFPKKGDVFILKPVDTKEIVTVASAPLKIFKKHLVEKISFAIEKRGSHLFSRKEWIRPEGVNFDSEGFIPSEIIEFGEKVTGIDNQGKAVFAQEILGKKKEDPLLLGGEEAGKEAVIEFIQGCAKINPQPTSNSKSWFARNKTRIALVGGVTIMMGVFFLFHKVPIEVPEGMNPINQYADIDIKEALVFLFGGAAFAFSVLFYETLPPK